MPTYQFQAMDATGQEIHDVIDASTEEEAQATIREMGYFVTKISVQRAEKAGVGGKKKRRGLAIGGGGGKVLAAFTRQLSILQDAGLPILRSLKILGNNAKPGKLKFSLMDVCEEIEGGSTLSEAMGKSPKMFNRLYVNMIKAGEAGGALEIILQRLAEFMERSQSLKRKVIAAMIYPAVVVSVAVLILTGIMIWIVPVFKDMFADFGLTLPPPTLLLIAVSDAVVQYWYLVPMIPLGVWMSLKLLRKFKAGRMGWDIYTLRLPIMGKLVEKNILARSTRTLGTLISSGVPILEALTITRETAGNAVFEKMYGKVAEAIREGETIARPMKEFSRLGFHPMALFFWMIMGAAPGIAIAFMPGMGFYGSVGAAVMGVILSLFYLTKIKTHVVDDLVVNMVDVGEETGELDTMLYKVADQYDDEVKTLTDGLMATMEPLLIVFLGTAVGFIVVSLFMPLVQLITSLS